MFSRISQVKQLVFLGTGCSSSIPSLHCLLQSPPTCKVCVSAMQPGSLNRRRNVSLLIRYRENNSSSSLRTGIIDCGKTFYEGALQWFPSLGISKIDWVLLTHGHADAIFGLDELRHFNQMQPSVDVYLSQDTFKVVDQTFPYLTDTTRATGGGDVSHISFHLFDHEKELELHGLRLLPIPVHHGCTPDGLDYQCLAYRFDNVCYISDCSSIPDSAEPLFRDPEILVLDTLRATPLHKSHFSLDESVPMARKLRAKKTLLVGMCHRMDHEETNAELQKLDIDVQLAYDGQIIDIELEENPGNLDLENKLKI